MPAKSGIPRMAAAMTWPHAPSSTASDALCFSPFGRPPSVHPKSIPLLGEPGEGNWQPISGTWELYLPFVFPALLRDPTRRMIRGAGRHRAIAARVPRPSISHEAATRPG